MPGYFESIVFWAKASNTFQELGKVGIGVDLGDLRTLFCFREGLLDEDRLRGGENIFFTGTGPTAAVMRRTGGWYRGAGCDRTKLTFPRAPQLHTLPTTWSDPMVAQLPFMSHLIERTIYGLNNLNLPTRCRILTNGGIELEDGGIGLLDRVWGQ